MGEWIETEVSVKRIIDVMPTVAELGAELVGLLPSQRGRHDKSTVEDWLSRISDPGVRPFIHHHGATALEHPDEIRYYPDAVDGLELVFDTAHYLLPTQRQLSC